MTRPSVAGPVAPTGKHGPGAPYRRDWLADKRGALRPEDQDRLDAAEVRRRAESGPQPLAAPGAAGTRNWVPVGPSCINTNPGYGTVLSGRVRDLAPGPAGSRGYAATADGGVWRFRRGDPPGAQRWDPLGDFTVSAAPRTDANALACGAMHVAFGAAADGTQDVIMVGTGEPIPEVRPTPEITGTSPTFNGIGIRVSSDGGRTWHVEAAAPLTGAAVYRLLPDPATAGVVWAATTAGLFRRDTAAIGAGTWTLLTQTGLPAGRPFHCTDVAIGTFNGARAVFAAIWRQRVYRLTNEGQPTQAWATIPGMGSANSRGRICLAVAPSNPAVLYSLDQRARLHRIHNNRLVQVLTTPRRATLLPGNQGYYDLDVAVDPTDPDTVWLVGDYANRGTDGPYDLSLWQATLTFTGGRWRFGVANAHQHERRSQNSPLWRGGGIHADGHRIRFGLTAARTADASRVWVGCDGGVWESSDSGATFGNLNTGLATLQISYFDHHPTNPHELLCGFQDNSLAYSRGDAAFSQAFPSGDGGGVAINPANPQQLIGQGFADNAWRSTTGPFGPWRYTTNAIPSGEPPFYAAITSSPAAPAAGPLAGIAPTLIYPSHRLWVSRNFGRTWTSMTASGVNGRFVRSIAFAAFDRFYVADRLRVFRYEGTVTGAGPNRRLRWTRTRLRPDVPRAPRVPPDPRPPRRTVTDLTVIPGATAAQDEIYVTLGGAGPLPDPVQRYATGAWTNAGLGARFAHACTAIVADTSTNNDLYVGTDTGVWHGVRAGPAQPFAWTLFSPGLPESTVLELKIHQPSRLLRAGLHGRGVWEVDLASIDPDPGIYIRASSADDGRRRANTVQGVVAAADRDQARAFDTSPDIRLRRSLWTRDAGPAFAAPALRLRTPRMPGGGMSTAAIITRWQSFVARRGVTIAVNGTYDRPSRDACREVQRRLGLLADGVVGATTWAATVTNPALPASLDYQGFVADIQEDVDQATNVMLADATGANDVSVQVAMRGANNPQAVGELSAILLVASAAAAPPQLPADWANRVNASDTTNWLGAPGWRFATTPASYATNPLPMSSREPAVVRWSVDFQAAGFTAGDEVFLFSAATAADQRLVSPLRAVDQIVSAIPGTACRRVRLIAPANIP